MDLLGKISKDLSKTQTTTVSTKYFLLTKGGLYLKTYIYLWMQYL